MVDKLKLIDLEVKKFEASLGIKVALTATEPRVGGFQLQIIDVVTILLIQPGILFPFAKNVIFPGAPTVAVNAIFDDLLAEETLPAIERSTDVAAGSTKKVMVTYPSLELKPSVAD